jgi:antiviral helicase SKI2
MGDLEFAVRGGIDDLGAAWSALLPHMALRYPFELDTFQKEAVLHLEAGRSVGSTGSHTYCLKTPQWPASCFLLLMRLSPAACG